VRVIQLFFYLTTSDSEFFIKAVPQN